MLKTIAAFPGGQDTGKCQSLSTEIALQGLAKSHKVSQASSQTLQIYNPKYHSFYKS